MIAKCKEKKGKYSQNPANEPNQKANRNNALHDDTNVKIEITLNGRMKAPISNPTIENQH